MPRFPRALLSVVAAAVVLAGCAATQNTLAQDLAWERWKQCDNIPGVTLKEIKTDGQIWVLYTDSLSQWQDCDRRAAQAQGARRAASPQPIPSPAPSGSSPVRPPLDLPAWKIGDEWAYRFENPDTTGTFVWSVARVETLDGQPRFVIATGTREIYYRVSNLGFTKETIAGNVVRQITPSDWRFVAFPLAVGKSWDMQYREVRPVARETEDVQRRCVAEAEETITVPAGTFATVRVSCKNLRSDAWLATIWYSPEVGQIVREEASVLGGKRVRELISYRLR
jgi:hypothetical protein